MSNPIPVSDPKALLDEHPAVRAAAERHAKAARRIADAVARMDARAARLAEIDAERATLADAIIDADRAALKTDARLGDEARECSAEISAIKRSMQSAESAAATAAEEYRAARASAAKAIAERLWREANDAVPAAKKLLETAVAAERRIEETRGVSQAVGALGRAEIGARFRGSVYDVRAQLLDPPVGLALPTSRLLDRLVPFRRLVEMGDDLEVEVADIGAPTERVAASWRYVARAPLPEDLAAALGVGLVARRAEAAKAHAAMQCPPARATAAAAR